MLTGLAYKNGGKPRAKYTQRDFNLIFTSQNLQKLRPAIPPHYFLINNDKNPVVEGLPK